MLLGPLEVALGADRRIAGDNAKLGVPEVLLGVIPGGGGTQRLARLIGPSRAKDLVFTGRFVGAEEALQIGLVDQVVAPDDVYNEALKWAGQFAGAASVALAAAKTAIDAGSEVDLATGLKIEEQVFAALFATDDRTIGTGISFYDPRVQSRFESGGGGLSGTAPDYARFAQALLNGGELDGKRLLSPATLAFMASDHLGASISKGKLYLPGAGYGFGLGFGVRTAAGESPFASSVGEYYWGGAGGTYFWVDPKQELFAVFMMQSPKNRVPYRSVLRNMVYAAIVD